MNKLYIVCFVSFVTLTVAACAEETAPPTLQPLPTPTIPPDFVTFTDETSRFSIMYPRDWELARSMMSDLEQFVKDVVEDKDPNFPVESTSIVFLAGLPSRNVPGTYAPNVNIMVESLDSEMTAAEYAEAGNRITREFFRSYQVHDQTEVLVGDMEAQIVDWSYALAEVVPAAEGRWNTA